MISAKIICDSIADSGFRLTTYILTYPRFLHAEFMTHRVFSRNASSSRAIPVKKQIQMVIDNPAIPIAFTKNKAGMQGGEILDSVTHDQAVEAWLRARDQAVIQARVLADLEVHKQYANRILEPWAHITVVCTATHYDNFFALRIHPAALPEICELATQMYKEYTNSKPQYLEVGQWHIPFISKEDFTLSSEWMDKISNGEEPLLQVKRSVARCARVSYLNHEGTTPTIEQDLQLYDRLLGAIPIHASPAEHQACASDSPMTQSGNFRGWTQYRKTLENENVYEYKPNES